MRRRRYQKGFISPPGQRILLLTIIIFTITVIVSILFIDRGIKPTLMNIARDKTNEFATRAINQAVRFAEDYDFSEVANITYDNEGKFVTYFLNPSVISEIDRNAVNRIEEFFDRLNRGDPIHTDPAIDGPYDYTEGAEERMLYDPTLVEIPLGQVTGNTVLSNLGPRIPINMEVVGTVRTNVIRDEESFGINGTWISLYLQVEVDVQVIIPFSSDVTTVTNEIYIDGGAIMGDIPDFYGGGSGGPSIAVPKDDIQNDLHDEE